MPATPQDHKRPKAETANEPFEFEHNGETFTLPPSSSIKAGMLRRFRKLSDLDLAFSILEEIADADALAALDDMEIAEFNQAVTDWQSHIGLDAGN